MTSFRFSRRFRTVALPALLGLGVFCFSACSGSSDPEASSQATGQAELAGGDATSGTSAQDGDRLQVVTTFLPMTQFTKAVAGDRAEVTQLLPTNLDPHDYQAKPSDAQRLATADVLVQNGLELENFLEPMLANAENADLLIVDSSAGLTLLAMAEDDHGHGDEHGHDHDHGDDHDESKADHKDESSKAVADADDHDHDHGHDHGEFDPHVWLDPLRAVQQVENIRDGLIAADPAGADQYRSNAAAYIAQLQALDQEISQALAPFAGKTFVTFHDFAGYFGDRYNLRAEYLVNVPAENPSPEDVQRVMAAAQASELKTLLTDSEASANAFAALAQDLGVQVSTFRPNEAGGPESIAPEAYFVVMRENLANLRQAFGASS